MQFFEDSRGCLRPVADIKIISPTTKEVSHNGYREDVHGVVLADGKTCDMPIWQKERLEQAPIAVLPAAPETYLLLMPNGGGDAAEFVWKTPILGWAITATGSLEPYTADGRYDGLSNARPILYPNGIVSEQHNQSWRSEAHWASHVLQERQAKAVVQ